MEKCGGVVEKHLKTLQVVDLQNMKLKMKRKMTTIKMNLTEINIKDLDAIAAKK